MSERRFQQLLRCTYIHYENEEVGSAEKLHKVVPLIKFILNHFQKAF